MEDNISALVSEEWGNEIAREIIHRRVSQYVYILVGRIESVPVPFHPISDPAGLQHEQRILTIAVLRAINSPRTLDDMLDIIRDMGIASDTSIFVGVVYLHRFLRSIQTQLPMTGVQSMLMVCIYLASKVYEDECYNLLTFSLICGVRVEIVRSLERELLRTLKYKLIIPPERIHALASVLRQPEDMQLSHSSSFFIPRTTLD